MASTFAVESGYWSVVVPSMVLIAAGLGLVTAPATEAIMGSLPPSKAGVGSAVNDTTRELGGTLGVAVVGSVFASVYGPNVVEAVRGLPLPAEAVAAARESMAAAVVIAGGAPSGSGDAILDAARAAFMDGMAAGSRIAALACVLGVLVAWRFLPARASTARDVDAGGRLATVPPA